jgi:hypothetical protein
MTATLSRFASAADSLMVADRARVARGETPRAAADVLTLADQLDLRSDALRARHLYLGQRPASSAGDLRDIELAVITDHEGPFPVRLDAAAVTARRVTLDDNAISRSSESGDWEAGSLTLVEEGSLIVYHHRSDLRRAAARLYADLERRGGRSPGAPADTSLTALATALRLRATSPLFDRARATTGTRQEARRLFILEVMAARMAQVETAGARHLLDQRETNPASGALGAKRRLLSTLRQGPLPGLALADAADRAARADRGDDEGAAARAVLEELRSSAARGDTSNGRRPEWAILFTLGEDRLRTLATGIE